MVIYRLDIKYKASNTITRCIDCKFYKCQGFGSYCHCLATGDELPVRMIDRPDNCPLQFIVEDETCEYSKDGKCIHSLSEGELDCNGTDEEKSKCIEYSEINT